MAQETLGNAHVPDENTPEFGTAVRCSSHPVSSGKWYKNMDWYAKILADTPNVSSILGDMPNEKN